MATVNYALTSESRIKTRITISGTGQDTLIKRVMYSVTDLIEKHTGRRFKRQTISNELYDGSANIQKQESRRDVLILKNAPVASITSIEYKTNSNSSPTWVAFSVDDYDVNLTSGIVRFKGGIPAGMQNIRVSYVAGYLIDFSNEFDDSLHTLPYDISDLCERLTIKIFKKRESEGRSQETFRESSIVWSSLLSEEDKSILANYKREVFV